MTYNKRNTEHSVISLFSGCGGLDLGFQNAGFKIVFSNDFDKDIWETYEKNFGSKIDGRPIQNIKSEEIPAAEGVIGGPPCQSWSLAGSMRGFEDPRGKLLYEYIRIIKDKKPLFFVLENVPGLISKAHNKSFQEVIEKLEDIKTLEELGYNVAWDVLNAKDYGCPESLIRYRSLLAFSKVFVPYSNDFSQSY
jgi:DNA (cytosine-5)-methyltransferase 1